MADQQENGIATRTSNRSTGTDIGDLQQKISKAERELQQLRLELDQTRQQAKQAELHSQESGRTNRKLKTEIQTLTDMSNRKDRQAENAKAMAFFFEGQVKKYTDEIETARQGMGHLKELDDELRDAKKQQEQLENAAAQEYGEVREEIARIQKSYQEQKDQLKEVIMKAYEELADTSARALKLQQEVQARVDADVPTEDIELLEREHEAMEKRQFDTIKSVQEEVDQLKKKLDASEDSTKSHEEIMTVVKSEMDRIMRRLRAIDQAELN
ncbi:hypothetical protein DFQ28_006400 [Apophysomyces sp. BC1034]|nr:hypothetical protein DFQ30_007023 [Apophysomyces sp. BC1015]KAG0177175.1 hypothetical protein DFQ29_005157 [Apophysomyces sp. BC1021]KAG0187397.1 hypothetical protein DFQ28_006400 [Apophysomyces sp. BC1034]